MTATKAFRKSLGDIFFIVDQMPVIKAAIAHCMRIGYAQQPGTWRIDRHEWRINRRES
jgi:hypothetical protein